MKKAIQFTEREIARAVMNYAIQEGHVLPGTYDLNITFEKGSAWMTYETSKPKPNPESLPH